MSSPGVVYVDETVDEYKHIRLPSNWRIHYERKWGSLGASMAWCLAEYPHASQYGWLADDTVPRTPGWDRQLENVAGDWNLSYARDLWISEDSFGIETLRDGTDLSSGLCWGGELVRKAGWWAPPGLVQAGIDTAWTELLAPLGLCRYTHQVIVEHKNWRTGKREFDEGDEWQRGDDKYVARDIATRNSWVASEDFRRLFQGIILGAHVKPNDRQIARIKQRISDSYANEHWKPGMSAAKLVQVLERINAKIPGLLADVLDSDPYFGPARSAAEGNP